MASRFFQLLLSRQNFLAIAEVLIILLYTFHCNYRSYVTGEVLKLCFVISCSFRYAMHELGLTSKKPFKKCARVVGEVSLLFNCFFGKGWSCSGLR